MRIEREQAWVVQAIKELRAVKSWTGRIHVQKLLFIIQVLKYNKEVPYRYSLYHYGPYSRSLDYVFSDLEACGVVNREFKDAGYGPRYNISMKIEINLGQDKLKAIHDAAEVIGNKNSKELELIATAFWVRYRENIKQQVDGMKRIKEIKPKYTDNDIKLQWDQATEIGNRLSDIWLK